MSSKTIEIEAKSIDNAIAKACRDFGVPREKLNIEIISEGSSGFLGLMSKKARIRASLLSLDMNFSLDEENEEAPQKPRCEARPENRHEERPEARANIQPASKPSQTKPREKRVAPSAAAPRPPAAAPKPAAAEPTKTETTGFVPAIVGLPATTPAALQAAELLSGILTRMTFECRVTAMETDDTIMLGISGDESGLLIGRRGQNLDALQYIINKAVNRSETDRKMIVVDSEDYRRRREESLLDMAQRIRDKVKKTQKPLSLGHMNAHDRRIIHLALQEDEALITKSRGEGEYRKIIVLPARKTSNGDNARVKNRQ
jgi:spoIIIJ-associated protein